MVLRVRYDVDIVKITARGQSINMLKYILFNSKNKKTFLSRRLVISIIIVKIVSI